MKSWMISATIFTREKITYNQIGKWADSFPVWEETDDLYA